MLLPGNLRNTTLGDLLGQLWRAEASGWLCLQAGSVEHVIELDRGCVRGAHTPLSSRRLGDILRETAALGGSASRALERAAFAASPIGLTLCQAGVVSPGEVEAALAVQTRTALEQLFELKDARISFRLRGAPRLLRGGALEPRRLLRGRPRARDLRRARRPSPRMGAVASSRRVAASRLLGVSCDAGPAELRQALRKAARRCHPDRGPGGCEETLSRLTRAYHTLLNG